MESAILGDDINYVSYIENMLIELDAPVKQGYDLELRGPMETRIFYDFLNETLRRHHIHKTLEAQLLNHEQYIEKEEIINDKERRDNDTNPETGRPPEEA